jgi:hypothetical protein
LIFMCRLNISTGTVWYLSHSSTTKQIGVVVSGYRVSGSEHPTPHQVLTYREKVSLKKIPIFWSLTLNPHLALSRYGTQFLFSYHFHLNGANFFLSPPFPPADVPCKLGCILKVDMSSCIIGNYFFTLSSFDDRLFLCQKCENWPF